MLFSPRTYRPAVAWLLVLTVLLLLPGSSFPDEGWFHQLYLDKWVHIAFFFLLVILFVLPSNRISLAHALGLAAAGTVYGIAIEFAQGYLVPGRSFEFADILSDAAGAVAGGLTGYARIKK